MELVELVFDDVGSEDELLAEILMVSPGKTTDDSDKFSFASSIVDRLTLCSAAIPVSVSPAWTVWLSDDELLDVELVVDDELEEEELELPDSCRVWPG